MQLRDIIATGKTIALEELAKDTELAKEVQSSLVRLGLLDPPADGKFGRLSIQALKEIQSLKKLSESGLGAQTSKFLAEVKESTSLKLGNDLASRIIKYMLSKQYFVSVGEKRYNIVYLEGSDKDGVPNKDTFNEWNDRRIVIEIVNGVPTIVGNWKATSEPGRKYTKNPLNPQGAFRIAFGQYKAWKVGFHQSKSDHEALVQRGEIKGHRDINKDGKRTGDPVVTGDGYGVNQHHGWNMEQIEGASAGCLVGQSKEEHRKFMALIKQDRRYQLNSNYFFFTTIIAGDDLVKAFPA